MAKPINIEFLGFDTSHDPHFKYRGRAYAVSMGHLLGWEPQVLTYDKRKNNWHSTRLASDVQEHMILMAQTVSLSFDKSMIDDDLPN